MKRTAREAGWYPAPGQPGKEQRWDGEAWTDEVRLLPPLTKKQALWRRYELALALLAAAAVVIFLINAHNF